MNIFGHLLIANSVRKDVYRQTGIRLSFSGYLCGNILPDISDRYRDNPHFFKDSLPFVLERAEKLPDDMDSAGIQSFSCSLLAGVISHYLSDFFCYAHCGTCGFSLYRHHWYEFCMLGQFGRGLRFCRKQPAGRLPAKDGLEAFIRESVEFYNRVCGDRWRDFGFALSVCSQVVVCLLQDALCREQSPRMAFTQVQAQG